MNSDPATPGPDRVLNFAYGSNMCSRRLRARVASARALGIGRLAGYRLAWHKRGRDGTGKCDLVATGAPEDTVWGVLFAIARAQKPLLDAAEGLGRGYREQTLSIVSGGAAIAAFAYLATDIDAALRPFGWYHALVAAGAAEHGLPLAYRQQIDAVATLADPDRERAQLHFALARGEPHA